MTGAWAASARLALPLVLFLLLAGCASERPPPSPAPDVAPRVPPAGRFNLTGAMDTEVTATFGDVGYTYAAEGGNCVVYSADDVRHVHAGAVTVAWAPASPAQQSLRLVVSPDPHGEAAEATGASPLRVDVPDLDVATRLALYVTAASEPGAIVRQPMRLEWSLDYDGAASPADPSTHARCG